MSPVTAKKPTKQEVPDQRATWELQRRLTRDFPGIEREVETLFFKHEGADTATRLKLLWGFIKADKLDFKQFERLVNLIHNPKLVGATPEPREPRLTFTRV